MKKKKKKSAKKPKLTNVTHFYYPKGGTMRVLILTIGFLFPILAFSQKSKCYYQSVDTVVQYKNAEVISYQNKKDTIYWNKQKCDVVIQYAKVMIVNNDKMLKPKK